MNSYKSCVMAGLSMAVLYRKLILGFEWRGVSPGGETGEDTEKAPSVILLEGHRSLPCSECVENPLQIPFP